MQRGAKGSYCSKNNNGVLKEFIPRTASDADATKVRDQCEAHCLEVAACQHCSVHCASGICQWNAIPTCGTRLSFGGKLAGDTSTKLGVCLVCPPSMPVFLTPAYSKSKKGRVGERQRIAP